MNAKIKLLFKLLLVTLFFTFSSCEKDLYEEAIKTPETHSKINYVKINQVPFLIPVIQSFNHDYDYLTPTSKKTNKEVPNLNLDLNKILEYITADGLKSYSIKIKNQFQESDDKYFENLNIYEKDGVLHSFILKYNSIDDNTEFNFSTFTGEIDLYDLDKVLHGIIQYENGEKICLKITLGHWHILDFGGGDIYAWNDDESGDNGNGGGNTGGDSGTGSNTGGSDSGSSGSGSSGSGSSSPSGGGGGGGGSSSGGSTPVIPNPVSHAEQWIYNLDNDLSSIYSDHFFSLSNDAQTLMINYIIQNNYTGTNLLRARNYIKSLISDHNGLFNFLASSSVQTQTSVFNYLIQNNFNSQSTNFVNWGINYLLQNPNVSFQQFQNWFMMPREGKDGNYDESFWENPNLNFPQQQLPTYSDFDSAYPHSSGAELAQLIGGDVLQLYNEYPYVVRGFCALKVSRGLNYSGVIIPQITTTNGNPGTVLGSDGKYYFLNAKALNKWMRKTFGVSPVNTNHIHINGSEGGTNGENFPDLTTGVKGIYSMVSFNAQWASGHADLINDGVCVFGCHFYDSPPAPIDYIDIWILN